MNTRPAVTKAAQQLCCAKLMVIRERPHSSARDPQTNYRYLSPGKHTSVPHEAEVVDRWMPANSDGHEIVESGTYLSVDRSARRVSRTLDDMTHSVYVGFFSAQPPPTLSAHYQHIVIALLQYQVRLRETWVFDWPRMYVYASACMYA